MARRERLTKAEKAALVNAGNEVLAGEGDGWSVPAFTALKSAVEKLKVREDDDGSDR